MKYGRQAPISPPERAIDAGHGRRAGFTLIEVVIAVVILGILSAAVAVNWASFIRYQELRQDAYGFHKELLALKAKALEIGDTVWVSGVGNDWKIETYRQDSTGEYMAEMDSNGNSTGDNQKTVLRVVGLSKDVKIHTRDLTTEDFDEASMKPNNPNEWENKITVYSNNLSPFFKEDANGCGWVVITSSKTKKEFCIILKTENSIKPELFSKSGANGKWTKI